MDRANPKELAQWRARCGELRAGLVSTRRPATLFRAGERWGYPLEAWSQLPDHDRQWLEVVAAGKGSTGSILVGRSAARVHGMWVFPLGHETVELSLRGGGSSPGRCAHPRYTFRHSRLRGSEIREVNGLLVTSAIRTFADIARYHGFAEGLVAADWLRFRGLDADRLHREITDMGRLKGIGTVRRCAEYSTPVVDSGSESLARGLLITEGIGPLTPQYTIGGYRVDLLIGGWLIIEIDGAVKYRGPDAEAVRQREFNRQKEIANRGYVFLRYSPEFVRRTPHRFIAEVRETLASRGRLRG